ncbi:MAG TPA: hypothetical protein VGN72_22875 [Tepidisphaeraceae bacterium]|nr:hypothetical protein [Tepidisphaeraceae bacterium]
MTQIDRHVAAVQNKLAFAQFLKALGWALLIYAGIVWINILVDRLFSVRLPYWGMLFWIGLGVSVAAAIAYAVWRRPDPRTAAVAIDERLGLKEKFSTALYARNLKDPFAAAAVRDAEASAAGVELRGKFKLAFPRVGYAALGAFAVVLLTHSFLDRQNLFASPTTVTKKNAEQVEQTKQAKEVVKRALSTVEQAAKVAPEDEKIALAKKDLEQALNRAEKDPVAAKRTALKAQQEMEDAIKQKIKDNQKFAEAQNNERMIKGVQPPPTAEKGPVADAHRSIAKGEFSSAVEDISKAVENFDKMDKENQEKAAKQMDDLAKQLQKMANDPKVQQQMQQQLQQMGANQQQAQDIAKKMQQAANGDKQAQQQLQQMQQQLTQQMNNGQGPTPQQQQQIQQMMKQMQAQANTQQGAQAMAQAAQQMAQAMQQQAGQQQQQQNPNQQGQQQAGQQQGQQGQQQQAQQGQQQGQQPGQQPGGQQQQQQAMGQGQQQMQQQLQQMQAMQQDMQQMAAAQQAAQQGAQQAQNAMNGQGGQQGQGGQDGEGEGGQGQGQADGGQDQQGPPGNQNGMAGGGIGAGDRSAKQAAPFTVKQEISQSQEDDKGKILASRWVKAGSIKGESKAELADVAASAEQAQTDEVEQERITGQAREAQKRYFNSLSQDAE